MAAPVYGVKHSPIVTFCVDCGACGTELGHPATGSLTWDEADSGTPKSVTCYVCGVVNKIPRGFSRTKAKK